MNNQPGKNGRAKPICENYLNFNFITKFLICLTVTFIGLINLILIDIPSVEISEYFTMFTLLIPAVMYLLCFIGCMIFTLIALYRRINPKKSKLGKAILCQTDNSEYIDLKKIFNEINNDISRYGRKYGMLYIGKEWLIGRCGAFNATAVRKKNIRGIFKFISERIMDSKQRMDYQICINDKNDENALFNIGKEKELNAAYDLLTNELPYVRKGNKDNYMDFIMLSDNERNVFLTQYEELMDKANKVQVEKNQQNFTLSGSNMPPTSRVTANTIKIALKNLMPGQSIKLSFASPLANGSIVIFMQHKEDSPGFYELINIMEDKDAHVAFSAECDFFETEKILLRYFSGEDLSRSASWVSMGNVSFVWRDSKNDGKIQIDIGQY